MSERERCIFIIYFALQIHIYIYICETFFPRDDLINKKIQEEHDVTAPLKTRQRSLPGRRSSIQKAGKGGGNKGCGRRVFVGAGGWILADRIDPIHRSIPRWNTCRYMHGRGRVSVFTRCRHNSDGACAHCGIAVQSVGEKIAALYA